MNEHTHSSLIKLLSILLLMLFSCNQTLKLPDVDKGQKIALLGELTAGDSSYIRAGQSIPLTASSHLKFEILEGISISMDDADGNKIPLNGYLDDYAKILYTLPFSSPTKITAGSTYTITATHPAYGTAKAIVQIPKSFETIISGLANTIYANDSVIKIDIQINDASSTQNYYVIEAVKQIIDIKGYFKFQGNWLLISGNRQQYEKQKATGSIEEKFDTTYYKNYLRNLLYSRDINIETALSKGSNDPNRRILLRDLKFNGQNYNTTVYIRRDYYDSLSNTQKGRLLLQVKSIPEPYFKYLKRYDEQADQNEINTLAQPLKVEGNIINGLGIIGGVYKNEFVIRYDTWLF